MGSRKSSQSFDLEDRTFQFARRVRALIKVISMTLWNREDARQLVRASGSVGANYIEANNALGEKDFLMRIKICRKETRESGYGTTRQWGLVSGLRPRLRCGHPSARTVGLEGDCALDSDSLDSHPRGGAHRNCMCGTNGHDSRRPFSSHAPAC